MASDTVPLQTPMMQLGQMMRHPFYCSVLFQAERLYKAWNIGMQAVAPEFVHPLWIDARGKIAQLVQAGVPYSFLRHPIVQGMFVRTGFENPQRHELAYLKRFEDKWNLRQRYTEAKVGGAVIDCPELGISVNSLGMLYYFARIAEELGKKSPNTVIEFGGGYGSLCRVFLRLLPKVPTYIILDLPEMLTLQYLFLRTSALGARVVAHTALPLRLKEGCVNLVPVYLLRELTLKPDLFVSTFALSETTRRVQQIIIEKRFYGARSAYIVGQNHAAEMWKGLCLESSEMISRAADNLYDEVKINPFHFGDSWELLARNHDVDRRLLPQ